MKDKATAAANHAALFRVCIKSSESHGLDEIRISVPRAKQILRDLEILKAAVDTPSRTNRNVGFNRLDQIFSL